MDNVDYIKIHYGILTNLEISQKLGISVNKIRRMVYKHIPFEQRYRRGKSPHCKSKRKYNVNDKVFSECNEHSCYWAGMMAADGNIHSKNDTIFLGLKESDKAHIEKFKEWLSFEGPVRKATCKYTYKGVTQEKYSYNIAITSKQLKEDLYNNFNISSKKSLTILPPNLTNSLYIDAFIKGYIDGDGYVGTDKDNTSRFSIIGTFEMLSWINTRFGELINKKLPIPTKRKNKNVWVIDFRNKISRTLLKHLFEIPTPELDRKWTSELKEIVFNYKKSRNIERYKLILNMRNSGMNQIQIAKELNVSSAAISWIEKQELYKTLIKESSDKDNGGNNLDENN